MDFYIIQNMKFDLLKKQWTRFANPQTKISNYIELFNHKFYAFSEFISEWFGFKLGYDTYDPLKDIWF